MPEKGKGYIAEFANNWRIGSKGVVEETPAMTQEEANDCVRRYRDEFGEGTIHRISGTVWIHTAEEAEANIRRVNSQD